ncbi:MAG TPA: 50S ribosomal protein L3 N(5)-glutamine methyltransferase [Acidiferrobacteraceae bacterium]|nr:50S ribosomal protein L3 N(5)-glutamine methyltransferase [Acidiferrobacteraceae bacterium]
MKHTPKIDSNPPASLNTVKDFVLWGEKLFDDAGIFFGHGTDSALDEAAWLILHALGLPVTDMEPHLNRALNEGEKVAIKGLLHTRIKTRKPAAYLTGEAWFAGLPFYVDERVLVPRSHLAQFILERFAPWINETKMNRALDLCTGSGCIAVALNHAFEGARIDATDISEQALEVARRNFKTHQLDNRVRAIQSDLFSNLQGRHYDLIVSNPPYIEDDRIDSFPDEYQHEPRLALSAGPLGLDIINRIIDQASDFLSDHGVLVVEVGYARTALEAAHPNLPFIWLEAESVEASVFLLEKKELDQYTPLYNAGPLPQPSQRQP